MNLLTKLRAEELRHGSHRHIVNVISPDKQRRTTNKGICREFRDYFEKLFTGEPLRSPAQFDTYLADFICLAATEAVKCEGCITKEEIRQALKMVGTDKSPPPPGSMVCPLETVAHVCTFTGDHL